MKRAKGPKMYPTFIHCPFCGVEYRHSDINVAVHARSGRMAYAHEPGWITFDGSPAHVACVGKEQKK